MVCASTATGSKIVGGFVLLNVAALMTAWRACRIRPLGIGDFRTWLACREMLARRCTSPEGLGAAYDYAELANLLGVTRRRATASVRRLESAGLLEWSDEAITFPEQARPDEELDAIGRGRGSVAIPRRMLRHLAAGARPALIAATLGVLLRCLSRRKGGWSGSGRIKASWIASVFGVSLRQAKAARVELVALGWISPEPSDPWAERRWGRAFRIDLGWSRNAPCVSTIVEKQRGQATSVGATSSPVPLDSGATLSPPDLQTRTPSGREENQKPGGPAGFSKGGSEEGDKPLPPPALADVRLEDLKDTGRLLDLHRQAVERKLVTASEADRLRFVGAAEHAMAIASNPAALFAWIIRGACWRYLTQADEDSARQRLRLHEFGGRGMPGMVTPLSAPSPIEPGLSEDARIVREVRAACIRAGIYRDPWPAFQARNPVWDRARWDAALRGLGLA